MLDQQMQQQIVDRAEHWMMLAKESIHYAAMDSIRPSVVYKPKLSVDGDQWCALYGETLQEGVAGFGDSPYLAMCSFDDNWHTKLPQIEREKGGA